MSGASSLFQDAVPVHAFRPGEKIGRYVLLDQVGQGGMGVVFAAFDPQLNRKIALKILQASRADRSSSEVAELRARLFREAQAIARLSHPNVITVFDVGKVGTSVFVAMEFVEGNTLTDWLLEGRSREATLEMFKQAGRGLAAAHEAGLVHRDFKPDNVLVGFDGTARVSDFGLARTDPSLVVDEGPDPALDPLARVENSDLLSSPMTQTGAVVGTPRFMAPEQHAGAPPDPRSDQFAFCVALYQALYGQDPYVAHSMERLVMAKQSGRIRDPPEDARVPGHLEQLVWRGLSPDPTRRYPSITDLLVDLQDETSRPGRPVLRWVAALGLSSSVLVIAAIQGTGEEQGRCKDGRGSWSSIWSSERRASLSEGFAAASPDASEVAWQAVEGRIDGYIESWSEQWLDTCRETRVRRERSELVLALREACLVEQREAVDAVLEVFEAPDDAMVRSAPQTVAELPELSRCEDIPLLLAGAPLDGMPEEIKRARAELSRELARAQALLSAGKIREASEVSRAAMVRADEVEVADVGARARLSLGKALERKGDYAEAEAVLREAVWAATRTGHDETAAGATTQLVSVVGDRLGRYDEGDRWESHARALLDRLGIEGIARARLENNAGSLDYRRGDMVEGRRHYETALALRFDVRGESDPGRASWMVNLGNVALAERDLGEALQILEDALELTEKTLPPSHPTRASILATLGIVYIDKEEYAAAREALIEARGYFVTALGAEHPFVAITDINLANANELLGNVAEAADEYGEVAAVLSRTLGAEHENTRSAIQGELRCARKAGDLARARSLAQQVCPNRNDDGSFDDEACTSELAELDLDEGNLEEAQRGFEVVIATATKEGAKPDPRPLAETYLGLARTYRAKRDEVAAAKAARAGREVLEAKGETDSAVHDKIVAFERAEPPENTLAEDQD